MLTAEIVLDELCSKPAATLDANKRQTVSAGDPGMMFGGTNFSVTIFIYFETIIKSQLDTS